MSYCTAQWFGVDTMLGQIILGALGTKVKGTMAKVALSGLGTLIDNKMAARSAARKQANFYVNLRNAAQRAGFNPLTVLRSGTAGAYADAGYAPALTSNAFTNMFNDMRETDARISNMKAQERNMSHNQRMDKLNYELRKAEYQFNQGLASNALANQVPETRKNVMEGYSLGTEKNMNLAKFNGDLTTDEAFTSTQTRYTQGGRKYLGPSGEDGSEQALNAFYYAGEQIYDLYNDVQANGLRSVYNATKQKRVTSLPLLTRQKPPKLRFGPDYRDRMSLEGFIHNY